MSTATKERMLRHGLCQILKQFPYGRKVGYELREADDIPPEVFAVSATGVRGGNRANVSQKVMEFMIAEGIWDGE